MQTYAFDLVIIGSGAGGGTVARALADTGRRILVIERGDDVPSEAENWSPHAVWQALRYRTSERWVDQAGAEFQPYTHYNVGGNTKFWGSVLYRLRREDFGEIAHRDGVSPAWPIAYDDLAPWYDRAEALYHVRGDGADDPTEPPRRPYPYPPVPHTATVARVIDGLRAQGLHPSPLPLGLIDPGLPDAHTARPSARTNCTERHSARGYHGRMEGFGGLFGDPEDLQRRMAEFAEQM